eukprot:7905129-Pyramimonas_sp.AAC.1
MTVQRLKRLHLEATPMKAGSPGKGARAAAGEEDGSESSVVSSDSSSVVSSDSEADDLQADMESRVMMGEAVEDEDYESDDGIRCEQYDRGLQVTSSQFGDDPAIFEVEALQQKADEDPPAEPVADSAASEGPSARGPSQSWTSSSRRSPTTRRTFTSKSS